MIGLFSCCITRAQYRIASATEVRERVCNDRVICDRIRRRLAASGAVGGRRAIARTPPLPNLLLHFAVQEAIQQRYKESLQQRNYSRINV